MRAVNTKSSVPMLVAATLFVLLTFNLGCKRQANTAAQQPAPRTDQQITNDIQAKINGESALNGQAIQVAVQDGKATLVGQVGDGASRSLAANDAGSVDGVKTVVNNLEV